MKAKRFLLAALLGVFVFTSSAFSFEVEEALTKVPENSMYTVLKLDDTSALLKWIFSQENIDTFMPLILASKESNEILGGVEMLSAFAQNTPLKNIALIIGVAGDKGAVPFFQMAFNVAPEAEPFVRKITDGSAEPLDLAKLILGKDNPMVSLAESMLKVEKTEDNILKVDNELFIKAQDGMIIAALSADDLKKSLNALEHSSEGFFAKKARKFSTKDFACFHIDFETLKALDSDNELDLDEIKKYVEKPLDVEYSFERLPGKFLVSMALNIKEALSKTYVEKAKMNRDFALTKGGYISLAGVNAPLLAFGGMLNIDGLKATDEGFGFWKDIVKQAQKFGITEDVLTNLLNGALSVVLNDSVSVEGIKAPAVYLSQTGTNGAAEKIFEALGKLQFFHKVQDGVLQVDSATSPAPCFLMKDGETLKASVADLANIAAAPAMKPALEELMNKEASSAIWLDFAAIQSWILAPENGVLTILEPIARFSGQGEIFDALKEVLNAKFSVPSVSIFTEGIELLHTEYQIDETVKAEDGLMAKIVKVSRKFIPSDTPETDTPEKESSDKEAETK